MREFLFPSQDDTAEETTPDLAPDTACNPARDAAAKRAAEHLLAADDGTPDWLARYYMRRRGEAEGLRLQALRARRQAEAALDDAEPADADHGQTDDRTRRPGLHSEDDRTAMGGAADGAAPNHAQGSTPDARQRVPVGPRLRLRTEPALLLVRLARAIAAVPDLARRIEAGEPVVLIVESDGSLDALRSVLKRSVLPLHVLATDWRSASSERATAYLQIHEESKTRTLRRDAEYDLTRAIDLGMMIIVLTHPANRLPKLLTRLADARLLLPRLDTDAISFVLEATLGSPPSEPVPVDIAERTEPTDVLIATRRASDPDGARQLLIDMVAQRRMEHSGPRLGDLAGYGPAKEWGLRLAADLKDLKIGKIGWSEIDSTALLLSGPPGTGKTTYAVALAAECDVPLIGRSVAGWLAAGHLGDVLTAIRKSFAEARAAAPCILFIDEIDGIGDRATLTGEYVDYWTQIVNQLLEELAGVEALEGVVVIAATNHPQKIDPALLRAGRLDRHIRLGLPGLEDLALILRYHLRADLTRGDWRLPVAAQSLPSAAQTDMSAPGAALAASGQPAEPPPNAVSASSASPTSHADDEGPPAEPGSQRPEAHEPDLSPFARALIGCSGADITSIVRRARGAARRAGRPMGAADLFAEIDAIMADWSAAEQRLVAVHEAGHAVVVDYFCPGSVDAISIRTRTGGIVQAIRQIGTATSCRQLEDSLAILLAGRAAEAVILGADCVGLGSTDDLERATAMALKMETRFGFGSFGLLSLENMSEPILLGMASVREAIAARLQAAYDHASAIVALRRPLLEAVAAALERQVRLSGSQFAAIVAEVETKRVDGSIATASAASAADASEASADPQKTPDRSAPQDLAEEPLQDASTAGASNPDAPIASPPMIDLPNAVSGPPGGGEDQQPRLAPITATPLAANNDAPSRPPDPAHADHAQSPGQIGSIGRANDDQAQNHPPDPPDPT